MSVWVIVHHIHVPNTKYHVPNIYKSVRRPSRSEDIADFWSRR